MHKNNGAIQLPNGKFLYKNGVKIKQSKGIIRITQINNGLSDLADKNRYLVDKVFTNYNEALASVITDNTFDISDAEIEFDVLCHEEIIDDSVITTLTLYNGEKAKSSVYFKDYVDDLIVSFEVAKKLKEYNFNWNVVDNYNYLKPAKKSYTMNNFANATFDNNRTFPCYEENGKVISPNKYTPANKHYPRPTISLACEWIRTNLMAYISVDAVDSTLRKFKWKYITLNYYGMNNTETKSEMIYETVDEAYNAGILSFFGYLDKRKYGNYHTFTDYTLIL